MSMCGPSFLDLAIAGYVFGWMQWVNARSPATAGRVVGLM